jgi:CTP synthase (UTP-ammonia lyase)
MAFVHVALTFIGPTGELKTKPTQHSVRGCARWVSSPTRSSAARTAHRIEPEDLAPGDVEVRAVVSAPDAASI